MIGDAPADVFVELTVTDLETGQPAARHIEVAIDGREETAAAVLSDLITIARERR